MKKKIPNIQDYYKEVLLLRKKVEKYETVIRHAMFEKTGVFFICGEAGEKDSMGLPDQILICPANGLDGFASYKKHKHYSDCTPNNSKLDWVKSRLLQDGKDENC